MKCTDIEEMLSAYANDELHLAQRDFVERHLNVCPDCRAALADHMWVRQSLTALRATPVESDITEATMSKVRCRDGVARPFSRLLRPALIGIPLVVAIVVSLVLWLPGDGNGTPIAQAYAVNSALQSYRMKGSTFQQYRALLGSEVPATSLTAFEWEVIAPDRYHGKMTRDGVEHEFIIIGDDQYVRQPSDAEGQITIVPSTGWFAGIPRMTDTLEFIELFSRDEVQPKKEPCGEGAKECLVYHEEVDLDGQSGDDLSNVMLIIGEEDLWVRSMSISSRLHQMAPGPNGMELAGWVDYNTVVNFYDFGEPIEIERPLAPSGELLPGWRQAGSSSSPAPTVVIGGN